MLWVWSLLAEARLLASHEDLKQDGGNISQVVAIQLHGTKSGSPVVLKDTSFVVLSNPLQRDQAFGHLLPSVHAVVLLN